MFGAEFYPTPESVAKKMLEYVDLRVTDTILEPSAGKGDLVDAIVRRSKTERYSREIIDDIDTIEIDENLQHILRGKKYRVVHDDFLTFNTYKKYSLIIMNPPFSNGDKHLLKAIEMQERHGGQVVCLLNAETLNNPYSNVRKDLLNRLDKHGADVEYLYTVFSNAERSTEVDIALVSLKIGQPERESIIVEELRQKERYAEQDANYSNQYQMVDADFVKGIVEQYNFEIKAGLKLIAEWRAMEPLIVDSFDDDYSKNSILKLEVKGGNSYSGKDMENRYIQEMRMKYWRALFASEKFMGKFTSNLRDDYRNRVNELKDYDFSLWNIYTIRIQLAQEMVSAVEQTILDLFEEFSHKHYFSESSNNIHYYNGWKTNKSWKINNRVIIPLRGFCEYGGGFDPNRYRVGNKIADIEKVFSYLDDGATGEGYVHMFLDEARKRGQTKKIKLKYFYATFYKKGTCHIHFRDDDLLHKFNLFGSQRKGWLPPSYGKARYGEMTRDEQQVIDEFEGKKSYEKVMDNKDYYLVDSEQLLALTC